MIDGSGDTLTPKKPKKKEKEVIDKTRCNYHLCRKKTEVKRCIHCRGYYCQEHIKPIPPEVPNFDYPNKFEEWKKRKSAHPCPAYYMYLVRKEKERIKQTEISFEKMRYFEVTRKFDTESIEESKPTKKQRDEESSLPDVKCFDCGKDLLHSSKEYFFDKDIEERITICPECWNKRRQKNKGVYTKSKKKSKKWKATLIILSAVAFISILLLLDLLFNLF